MEDTPMFSVAPSHVYVAAHYDWRRGWSLTVSTPADDGQSHRQVVYEALSSRELVDVVAADLATVLGL